MCGRFQLPYFCVVFMSIILLKKNQNTMTLYMGCSFYCFNFIAILSFWKWFQCCFCWCTVVVFDDVMLSLCCLQYVYNFASLLLSLLCLALVFECKLNDFYFPFGKRIRSNVLCSLCANESVNINRDPKRKITRKVWFRNLNDVHLWWILFGILSENR